MGMCCYLSTVPWIRLAVSGTDLTLGYDDAATRRLHHVRSQHVLSRRPDGRGLPSALDVEGGSRERFLLRLPGRVLQATRRLMLRYLFFSFFEVSVLDVQSESPVLTKKIRSCPLLTEKTRLAECPAGSWCSRNVQNECPGTKPLRFTCCALCPIPNLQLVCLRHVRLLTSNTGMVRLK